MWLHKTTTINCIAGLVVPDGGSAEVFGHRVTPRDAAMMALTAALFVRRASFVR
jgi:ABC-type multidrug transport system ATPase subunit